MAINIDALPKDSGFKLAKGLYRGVVQKKEYIEKDGKRRLSVVFDLFNQNNTKAGTLFDAFFDSDKTYPLYKLGRFLRAMELKLSGSIELRDLARVIPVGKAIVLDVDQPEGSRYAGVTAFSECYYRIDEKPEFTDPSTIETPWADADDEPPFEKAGEEDEL